MNGLQSDVETGFVNDMKPFPQYEMKVLDPRGHCQDARTGPAAVPQATARRLAAATRPYHRPDDLTVRACVS